MPQAQTKRSTPSQVPPPPAKTPPTQQGAQALRGLSYAEGQARLTPPATQAPRQLQLRRATAQRLGQVDSLDSAIGAIGAVLDAMAPQAGEGFEGEVAVEIKPPAGMGFYMNLALNGSVKRQDDGRLEVEGQLALTVGLAGNAEIDTYWFGRYGAEWHAGVKGALGLKAMGDNGAHCMRLMGLGIHEWVGGAPGGAYVASKLFGDRYEADTLKSMKPAGSAKESSVEYSAALALDVGAGGAVGELGEAEASAELGVTTTTRLTKGSNGKKQREDSAEVGLTLALAFETGLMGASGEAEITRPSGQARPNATVSLELSPKEGLIRGDRAAVPKALADIAKPILTSVVSAAPVAATQRAALKAGMIWLPSQLIGAEVARTLGINCGYSLELEYEDGKFKGWSIALSREGEVDLGVVKASGKTTRTLASGEVEATPAPTPAPRPQPAAPRKQKARSGGRR